MLLHMGNFKVIYHIIPVSFPPRSLFLFFYMADFAWDLLKISFLASTHKVKAG